jgi:hypothetical protein
MTAERLGLGKVHVSDGQVVSSWQLGGEIARQVSDDPPPETLGGLELGHPESLRQDHLDLILSRPPFGLAPRAAHDEASGRTPAEPDRVHVALVTGLRANQGLRDRLREQRSAGCRHTRHDAEEHGPPLHIHDSQNRGR